MARTFSEELSELRSRSLHRRLRTVDSPQQVEIGSGGKTLLNFSSNDYLGFASHPAIREAGKKAIDDYGVGAGASRLICGSLAPHARLEEKLAAFKRTEAAITLSSGYATAVGTLGALLKKQDVVILDKLCHASLIDGARLSSAAIRVFPHNHLGKLESHLEWARQEHPNARVIIVTEAVFSMDGDRAPLMEIVQVKERYGAMLMLDEAHAVGVIGDGGRGLAEKAGVADRVEIQMGTLGKALGVSGGYICGSRELIDLIINRARSFIYSTAPPPAIAAAAEAAIDLLMSPAGDERRRQLHNNLREFAAGVPADLVTTQKVQSAIVPLMVRSEQTALRAARYLLEQGILVPAIRYPTVAKAAARLRVTMCALHTSEQIQRLCRALREVCHVSEANVRETSAL
jgi:8-amino-7-oxononanoate synthase